MPPAPILSTIRNWPSDLPTSAFISSLVPICCIVQCPLYSCHSLEHTLASISEDTSMKSEPHTSTWPLSLPFARLLLEEAQECTCRFYPIRRGPNPFSLLNYTG